MPLISALRWQRQAGLCEFVASLVHTVNSSTARVTQKDRLDKTKLKKVHKSVSKMVPWPLALAAKTGDSISIP